MSAILDTFTAGWTGRLGPYRLLRRGQPFDLTGYQVEMIVHNPRGLPVTLQGALVTGGLEAGQVAYDPHVDDFPNVTLHAASYRVRFKVTDSLGKEVFFPNGNAYAFAVTPQ